MTWNYRIVKITRRTDDNPSVYVWYGLYEVYYNNKGEPYTRTIEQAQFTGERPEEVVEGLGTAFQDALRYDVLDDDDIKEENEDERDTPIE